MREKRRKLLGSATLEFTLVGIPLMFVLISIVEISRGMWTYHTLAYAVKEGARFAIVNGQNSPTPATYATVCQAIVNAGTGLLPQDLTLTFTSSTSTVLNNTTGPYLASACPTTSWPGTTGNQPGQPISITATYPFQSAMSMFWPGAGKGFQFNPGAAKAACSSLPGFCLPAAASDTMQF